MLNCVCRLIICSIDNRAFGLVLTLTFISESWRLTMQNCICRFILCSIDNRALGLVLTLTFNSGSCRLTMVSRPICLTMVSGSYISGILLSLFTKSSSGSVVVTLAFGLVNLQVV